MRNEAIKLTLLNAIEGNEYTIQRIVTRDEELDAFLFSLGCYSGEPITVVTKRHGVLILSIKDGRYSIDNQLGSVIFVK